MRLAIFIEGQSLNGKALMLFVAGYVVILDFGNISIYYIVIRKKNQKKKHDSKTIFKNEGNIYIKLIYQKQFSLSQSMFNKSV